METHPKEVIHNQCQTAKSLLTTLSIIGVVIIVNNFISVVFAVRKLFECKAIILAKKSAFD